MRQTLPENVAKIHKNARTVLPNVSTVFALCQKVCILISPMRYHFQVPIQYDGYIVISIAETQDELEEICQKEALETLDILLGVNTILCFAKHQAEDTYPLANGNAFSTEIVTRHPNALHYICVQVL